VFASGATAGLATTVLVFALAGLVAASGTAVAQPPPATVNVAPVQEDTIKASQTFVGTVMPLRTSSVGSAVDGRIIEFNVRAGREVKEGQVLAQVLTGTIEIELAGAKADLKLRQEELAELQAGSRPEEKDQAKAQLLAAKAAMDYAASKYERTRKAFAQGRAATEDELQEAQSLSAGLAQKYQESLANYKLVMLGPRQEKIAQAQAQVLIQQEAVRLLEDRLAKYTIRAPFDGYVVREHTQKGQWIKSGELVAEVIELAQVEIEVQVPEDAVAYVEQATPTVTVDAVADRKLPPAEVSRVVPRADLRSRTFPVMVRLDNPRQGDGYLLKAGMLAKVHLPVAGQRKALLVPKDALVLGGRTPKVFVVDKKGDVATARAVPVEIGLSREDLIEVTGPLQAGEQVVTKGNERLLPGQVVNVIPGK